MEPPHSKRPLSAQTELPSPKRHCQHTQDEEDDDDDIGFLAKLLREEEDQQQQQQQDQQQQQQEGEEEEEEEDDEGEGSSHSDKPLGAQKEDDEEEEENTLTSHDPASKIARVESILYEPQQEEEHDLGTAAAAAALAAAPFRRPRTYNDNDLFRSLQLMDFESAQALLDYDPELMVSRDEDFAQPLAVAVEARFEKNVKYLLHLGCPLQEVDGRGFSALHIAVEAFRDMPFLLRYLLQYKGLDINARVPPVHGVCPLHLAADERVLKLLLSCGADPSMLVPVPVGRRRKEGEEGEEEEEDVLGRVERTWPRGKGKKKARFLLTRLSPYQSYTLAKLRFLTHMYSSCQSSSSSFLQSPTLTARAKIIDARLDEDTELLDLQKEDEEEAQADIWCKEEVKGQVFSFVENGHLYLARSRSISSGCSPPLAAAAAATASASSSSPSRSLPLSAAAAAVGGNIENGEKVGGPGTSTIDLENTRSSPPHPAGLCPLSVLKAARADFFLVSKYKEENEGEGKTAAHDSDSNSSMSNSTRSSSGRVEDEGWVMVPTLPRVEMHWGKPKGGKEKEEEEGGRSDIVAAVLQMLVYEVRDERVVDALQAMLWTGGGKKRV
eukprot:evm.model.NODE_13288_length_10806_cov_18.535257.2